MLTFYRWLFNRSLFKIKKSDATTPDLKINQYKLINFKTMTKLLKQNELPNEIDDLISNAQLEYFNDISWHYRIETRRYCIDFAKDETGKNTIEEFAKLVKGVWITLIPTDAQLKMMWFMLNMTPYRVEEYFGFYSESDSYTSTGTNPLNFL